MTGAAISQAAASGAPITADAPGAGDAPGTADAPGAGGAEPSGAPDPIGLKGLLAPVLPAIGLAFACGAVGAALGLLPAIGVTALAVARHAPRPGLLGAGRRHRRALRR